MNAKTLCIRSAVSTTILMLSCRGRDRDSLLRLVREADHGWMALAAAWVAASMGISTGKWRRLLRAQEISVSWGTLWRSYWMGLFFNNFLPSSVGFDAIRVLTLRDEGRTPGILLSVVVERLLALAGLALVGAIAVACGRASVGVGIPESLADSSDFLREGMLSGCCCCALTGAMMICGVLNGIRPHPLGAQLPKALHDAFRERFGAACCRVIRARRTLLQRIGRNACRDLTGETAAMTADFWAPVFAEAQRSAIRTRDIAEK